MSAKLPVAPLVLAVVLAGCSAGSTTARTSPGTLASSAAAVPTSAASLGESAAPSPSAASLWAQYFFPARVGYRCVLAEKSVSRVVIASGILTTATSNSTVTATAATASGQQATVHEYTTTLANKMGAYATHNKPRTQDSTLTYLVANDGTLLAQQGLLAASGLQASLGGSVVIPPVPDLLAGKGRDTSLTLSVTSTNPAYAAQIRSMTADGGATLEVLMVFHVVGLPAAVITTRAGTFRDTVGTHLTLGTVTAVNGKPGDAQLAQAVTGFQGFVPSDVVTYWAKGVGRVQTTSTTLFGTDTLKATSCH